MSIYLRVDPVSAAIIKHDHPDLIIRPQSVIGILFSAVSKKNRFHRRDAFSVHPENANVQFFISKTMQADYGRLANKKRMEHFSYCLRRYAITKINEMLTMYLMFDPSMTRGIETIRSLTGITEQMLSDHTIKKSYQRHRESNKGVKIYKKEKS